MAKGSAIFLRQSGRVAELRACGTRRFGLKAFPKTRLRLFGNPSRHERRAAVRGFSDNSLSENPVALVQQPVDTRATRRRQRVFG